MCACSGKRTPQVPQVLLADIEIPDRSHIAANGDLVRVILLDEEAMRLKNADLAAVRQMLESGDE